MNTEIKVMGTVKTNKNGTNYVDMAEGRIFLGKISGFKPGDNINGKAICKEQNVTYPARAAVGVLGQPGYIAAAPETTEVGWSCVNYISRDVIAKDLQYDAIEAKAKFQIAVTQRQTVEVAAMETTDLFALVN